MTERTRAKTKEIGGREGGKNLSQAIEEADGVGNVHTSRDGVGNVHTSRALQVCLLLTHPAIE